MLKSKTISSRFKKISALVVLVAFIATFGFIVGFSPIGVLDDEEIEIEVVGLHNGRSNHLL